MPLTLLAVSIALYCAGGIASLLLPERSASRITAISGGLAAVAGVAASLPVLIDGSTVSAVLPGPFSFAHFVVRLDPLAALMVLAISLLAAAAAVFGVAYVEEEYASRGVGAMGFFMNLFIASMLLVVVSDNAMWFIVFFEMMSLMSYFLVVFEQDEEAIGAGWLYFLIAHAGAMLVLIAFLVLFARTGSLDFAAFRNAALPPPLAAAVFMLAFIGFGAKAGMMPLHVWLPRAHPAAPSHASALLSGVMIKIGIFGIVKVGIDLLGAVEIWWGVVVLGFGVVSAVLGVSYALAERDIKRLLAYSSVENVGIILMGVGIGMIGIAVHQPVLAALGLLAGFYHLLNHAVFKSLLFLGAGAVISRVHTKDMGQMGGLLRLMPWTGLAFLVGALSICAIPPLNGFVSEWFAYQSLFVAALHGSLLLQLVAPLAAAMLAIASALALMCFVKAFGVAFSGEPRSVSAAAAKEVTWPMLAGMGLLAVCSIGLGVGAPLVAPVLSHVAAALTAVSIDVANGAVVFPDDPGIGQLSTPLLAVLLIGLATVPLIIASMFSGRRLRPRIGAEVWACGYAPDAGMSVSAGGFAEPVKVLFRPLYAVRSWADDRLAATRPWFAAIPATAARTEQCWDRWLIAPLGRGLALAGAQMQALQGGDLRIYCLYIVAALIVLLAVAIG